MAQPVTAKFGKMQVFLGDEATPIVYAAPCGLTTKNLTISKNLQEINIPDCDDPDAPVWLGRDVQNLSATILRRWRGGRRDPYPTGTQPRSVQSRCR